jgi:hypothetical protein
MRWTKKNQQKLTLETKAREPGFLYSLFLSAELSNAAHQKAVQQGRDLSIIVRYLLRMYADGKIQIPENVDLTPDRRASSSMPVQASSAKRQ